MKTILKLTLLLTITLTSCTRYYIESMESTDRIITGYSKNGKRYKVVNKYEKKECDIKIYVDTLQPGDTLRLKNEFNLCY